MKKTLLLLCLFASSLIWSQKEIQSSNAFIVTGQVKNEITFTISEIEKHTAQTIPDVTITNHLGEKKSDAQQLKGILLKTLLKDVELKSESAKEFSAFYFTFVATDGYKVVYSWNEIFNSPTGDHLFVVTEKDGEKLSEMKSRILTITTTDFKTGRRYVKGLSKIIVGRIE